MPTTAAPIPSDKPKTARVKTPAASKVDKSAAARRAFLERLYELDKPGTLDDAFDWVIARTDDLLCANEFAECDRIFADVDAERISASVASALLMSTFMARPRLPKRQVFIQAVRSKLVAERGETEASELIESLS